MHVCCVISIKYDDDDDDDDDHIYKIIATVHTQSKCHTFLHSGPGKNFCGRSGLFPGPAYTAGCFVTF